MRNFETTLVAAAGLWMSSSMAMAEAPQVVTDIPPVHSLVAQVMSGVGEPGIAMRPGASPHGYSLRPSEAAMLENADLVVWIGPILTPWMERGIDSLAGDAAILELVDVKGTLVIERRSGATFEAHNHDHDDHGDEHHDEHAHDDHGDEHHDEHAHDDHGDEHHDEHAHDDHGDENHDEHAHDDHGDEHHDEHAHDDHNGDEHHDEHGENADPHVWLAPENAATWLTAIAEALAELDPEHADAYRANAVAGQEALSAAEAEAAAQLAPVKGTPFVVFHDAYQYFETHFGVEAAGAISLGDASDPGPARVAEIHDTVEELGVVCVFAEPQFNPRLVKTVTEGSGARTAVLDPLGSNQAMGPDLYPNVIRGLAAEMAGCLQE